MGAWNRRSTVTSTPYGKTQTARVLKWLETIPAVGVCTLSNRQFNVPLTSLKRVADAQQSLSAQFAEHTCEEE